MQNLPVLEHLGADDQATPNFYSGPTPGFFHEVWTMFQRHRGLAIVIVFAGMGCVTAALAILKPEFRGTVSIMIQSRSTEVVKNVDPVLSKLPNDSDTVPSELEVLKSRDLLARLVATLHLAEDPEFDPNRRSGWQRFLGRATDALQPWLPESFGALANAVSVRDPLRGEARIQAAIDEVAQRLDVTPVGRSRVIKISFASHDPGLASTAANTLAELYVDNQNMMKQRASSDAYEWINANLSRLAQKVELAAQRVNDFKSANGMINGRDSSLLRQEISEVDSQWTAARARRMELSARLTNVSQVSPETSSEVLGSRIIQELRQQEATLANQNAGLDYALGQRNPRLQTNIAQLAEVKKRMRAEADKIVATVRNDHAVAQEHEKALQEQLETLKSQILRQQTAEVTLRQLEDEEKADSGLYDNFLRRSKETDNQTFQPPEALVISHATVPTAPYFPDKAIIIPAGVVGSLVIAFVAILGLEITDRGFNNQAQITKALGLPAIGIVPELRREDHRIGGSVDPLSLMGSAMTDIFMRMCWSSNPTALLIASALAREGKTLTALFLARIAAVNGVRVLLIDADLRRSGLREKLGERGLGLGDLLSGTASFEDAVHSEDSGIDFISCGTAVANPAGALISQAMRDLMAEARQRYQLILVDSPAIMAAPDAVALARLVDETILFVRWSRTPRQVAAVALDRLRGGGAQVKGAIMTRIDLKRIKRWSITDGLAYSKEMRQYYPQRTG